jgi:DNA repair protein RadC
MPLTPDRTPRAMASPVFEYRFTRRRIAEPIGTVRSPADVTTLLRDYLQPEEAEQERLVLAFLNVKNEVMGLETLYVGNASGSSVRVGEVFRSAVRLNASALVVAHNHPSGDPSPSREDTSLSAEIASAGRILDIELLDHVILGSAGRSVSLRALGYLE